MYCSRARVFIGFTARGESLASHRDGRGASRARRDDREYPEYLREEQRSPRGCIARRCSRLSPRAVQRASDRIARTRAGGRRPLHEPISRSPPASRNAASARWRPASASSSSARNAGSLRNASNCGRPDERRGDEVALRDRALQIGEPGLVLADVAQQPSLLEDRLRIVLDLQRAESRTAGRPCRRSGDRATPSGTRSTSRRSECGTTSASRAASGAPRRGGRPVPARSPGSHRRRRR